MLPETHFRNLDFHERLLALRLIRTKQGQVLWRIRAESESEFSQQEVIAQDLTL